MPGKCQFLDIKRRPEARNIPEVLIIRVDGSQIFLNTEDIKTTSFTWLIMIIKILNYLFWILRPQHLLIILELKC